MKKKKLLTIVCCALLLSISLLFAGCGEQTKAPLTIEFLTNNEIYTTITVEDLSELKLPQDPVKNGYSFDYWCLDENYNKKFDKNTYLTETSNIKVYAKWNLNEYEIKYLNTMNAENTNPTNYTIEDSGFDLKEISSDGYNFVGWYSDLNYVEKVSVIDTSSCQNITLYAKWQARDVSIKYHSDGGIISKDSENIIYGQEYSLQIPTKKGYNFDGWFTSSGTKVENFGICNFLSNLELFAKWSVQNYFINYVLCDGINNSNNILSYNVEIDDFTLLDPYKENYKFCGWFLDANYETEIILIDTKLCSNLTLYAKWKYCIEIPTSKSYTYSGNEQVFYENCDYYTCDNAIALNVGQYKCNFSLVDTNSYCWKDGTIDVKSIFCTITPLIVQKPSLTNNSFTYTGKGIKPFNSISIYYNILNDTGINVSTYNSIISLKDKQNYNWNDGSVDDITITWSIVPLIVSSPKLSHNEFVYTGNVITPFQSNNCFIGTAISGINVNSYTAKFVLLDKNNYIWDTNTIEDIYVSWEITPLEVEIPIVEKTVYNYSGKEITPIQNDSSFYEVMGGGKILAGEYKLIIQLKDKNNYIWNDKSIDDKEIDWSITKKWNGIAIKETFSSGNGTKSNPYIITYGAELYYIATQVNNGISYENTFFKLGENLDLNNNEWLPIGWSADNCFKGSINGNSFSVNNLKITKKNNFYYTESTSTNAKTNVRYLGLFGYINAEIENLIINNFIIDTTNPELYSGTHKFKIGGLVAYAGANSKINNCSAIGKINIMSAHGLSLGGLVGELDSKKDMTNCSANVDTTIGGTFYSCFIGGLIGKSNSNHIMYSFSNGSLIVESLISGCSGFCGGLIGLSVNSIVVNHCYSSVDVSAGINNSGYNNYAAGLIAYSNNGEIYNSYSNGNVSLIATSGSYNGDTTISCAGIVANGITDIYNSFATGNIIANISSSSLGSDKVSIGVLTANNDTQLINCYHSTSQTLTKNGSTLAWSNGLGIKNLLSTTSLNLKTKLWINEYLWKTEIDLWNFTTNQYPTLNYDYLINEHTFNIQNIEELKNLSGQVLISNYNLLKDIDLENAEWIPIALLTGNFNGNGHLISNYSITTNYGNCGLIAKAIDSQIINIEVNGKINNISANSGILIGHAINTTAKNIITSGNILIENISRYYSNRYGGGLIGYAQASNIANCYSTASLSINGRWTYTNGNTSRTFYAYCGGLIGGAIANSKLSNCFVNSTIYGQTSVGALVGEIDSSIAINNCYYSSTMSISTSGETLVYGDSEDATLFTNKNWLINVLNYKEYIDLNNIINDYVWIIEDSSLPKLYKN